MKWDFYDIVILATAFALFGWATIMTVLVITNYTRNVKYAAIIKELRNRLQEVSKQLQGIAWESDDYIQARNKRIANR